MRLLLNDVDPAVTAGAEIDDPALASLYAYPSGGRWLRANMVSTLDGAATGPDGKTGSINNEADHRVFVLLRALADVVVVGAGTARAEGYGRVQPFVDALASFRAGRPAAPALVLVSRSAGLPLKLATPREETEQGGDVLLATCEAAEAEALDAAREALGDDKVLVLGDDAVDLAALVDRLVERGLPNMLTEGGPRLLRDMVSAGVIDEICLTVVPHLIGGEHPRILDGNGVSAPMSPRLLLEADGTLLGRWSRSRAEA